MSINRRVGEYVARRHKGTFSSVQFSRSVMSNSVRPHRRQPTRPRHPWDSPGKNTGVGCHFLLQCMKEKSESEVAQSCLTLSDPMDCNLSGSSVHGLFQARVLEWGAIAVSCPGAKLEKWTEEMKMLLLPWTEEPGRLQSMGSLRVRHD